MTLRQLALPFTHAPQFGADDFLAAESNAAARAWLARTGDWPAGRLALWGAAGRGKTHLLHIWAGRTGAVLLHGTSLRGLPPPPSGPVALDDADLAADPRALLHLLNACAEHGTALLLSGRTPPSRWQAAPPDLASRLRATAAVELAAPEDELLRALLASLLAERQLAVPEAVQDWLRLRLPRTQAALREAAARLDHAALAAAGRITRGLAAAAMGELIDPSGDEIFASVPAAASLPAPCFL